MNAKARSLYGATETMTTGPLNLIESTRIGDIDGASIKC
jgi:hypothetical protein